VGILSKRTLLILAGVILLLGVGGCGQQTPKEEESSTVNDAVEIVGYNLETRKPLVILKNVSNKNLKDVHVKLTAKDDNGVVTGVREGNFGITTDIAMVPGQQVGMELLLGNGKFPSNAKLDWEISSETSMMTIPKLSILSSDMIIDDGDPVVSGEIKNESAQEVTVDMCFDYFKNGKIIGSCHAVYADTYDIPPGKAVSFSEKAYFLPVEPDSYQIHFLYHAQ